MNLSYSDESGKGINTGGAMVFVLYIVLSAFVGFWSESRMGSFWSGFLVSLMVTPVLGVFFTWLTIMEYEGTHGKRPH